jgi:general secretion pathway protein A
VYLRHFGLQDAPFELTPDPARLVLTEQHQEALSTLEYAFGAGKGLTVLTGDAGTGKTTIVRAALARTARDTAVVTLDNPALTRAEFLEFLALSFELSDLAVSSKTRLVRELGTRLERMTIDGRRCTLVVDEAQSVSVDLLEEVRLLGNLETVDRKLLPIVLVGQSELRERLNQADLRQLKQRVALRCELRALDMGQTTEYVATRLRRSGVDRALFTREALRLIQMRSGGIPRTINVICDNALIAAFAGDADIVGEQHVMDVVRDFDLGVERTVAQPAPVPARGVFKQRMDA